MIEPTGVATPPPPVRSPGEAAVPAMPAGSAASDRARTRTRRGRASKWRLWVVGAVLVGAFVFLLVEGLGSSLNYFETVDQALAHKTMLGSQTFRLEGLVVPGTVHRIPGGVAFVAAGTKHRVDVVNHGNPPQLFQPDIPVVVVGHFSGTSFISDQLIVDHSAQYVQAHPNRVKAPNGTTR
jgi:cytochrome c-type biogenesis protein CcmE